jgi:hypothetical protein
MNKRRIFSLVFDITFIVLALSCFALFTRDAIMGFSGSAKGEAIAKVTDGNLEQKRLGQLTFNGAGVDAPLYHRDAIWVGEGKSAKIRFNTNATLEIQEKTFLVLQWQYGGEETVEVFTGDVKITSQGKTGNDVFVVRSDRKSDATPEAAASPVPMAPLDTTVPPATEPSAAPRKTEFMRPKPDTVFYLAQNLSEVDIAFAWNDALAGFLVIQDADGREIARKETQNKTYGRMTLKSGKAYQWLLQNTDRQIQLGPVHFKIEPFSKEALGNALMGGQASHPFEIIN